MYPHKVFCIYDESNGLSVDSIIKTHRLALERVWYHTANALKGNQEIGGIVLYEQWVQY